MFNKNLNYNPDVLDALANLSNDEVFTPPKLANQVLDLLPPEIFKNSKTTFLDPSCKSGVFLREIAKRLIKGLKKEIPDLQKRLNHIYTKQLFGITITELTELLSTRSVYCTKKANGKYSVCTKFKDEKGNIKFNKVNHTWINGRCKYCGANEEVYNRNEILETHAYEFIHTKNPEEIFKMKFDVIIGNPPYQLNDGGGTGSSAMPIYHKFVEQAKKLNPRFLTMIIPARWFSGGKGLDKFRANIMKDKSIRYLVDYENSREVFPGVDIAGGICYFLRDRDNKGKCKFINRSNKKEFISERYLDEFNTIIRHSVSIPLIRRLHMMKDTFNGFMDGVVSTRKPFGIESNYSPKASGVKCLFTKKIGVSFVKKRDINDKYGLMKKWKLVVPFAPIAGQTDFSKPINFFNENNVVILPPNVICSETWLVLKSSEKEEELLFFKTYLMTKIFRFFLLQLVISQNITKNCYGLVPNLKKYNKKITDEYLKEKWKITEEEWSFIDSKIKSMD
jgi:site-specific DNA-methyltransferase (adenine-specific)